MLVSISTEIKARFRLVCYFFKLCQYAWAFRESGFTSGKLVILVSPVFVDGEHFEHESSSYGLLNFKCLTTNHATFNTQLQHVSASRVHA